MMRTPESALLPLPVLVLAALLLVILATLLQWVEDAMGLPAAEGWALARACVVACLRRFAADPALRPACEADQAAWLAPRVRAKALLRMRIVDASSDYAYCEVDNPLRDGSGHSESQASPA